MISKNLRSPILVSIVGIGFALLLVLLIVVRSDNDYSNSTAALQIASESGFVQVGSRQKIRTYTVAEEDTLEKIARKFGISGDTIRWANELPSTVLIPGRELIIPPVTGVVHTVKEGDTLSSIATQYRTNAQMIADFPTNRFADKEFALILGTILMVPDGSK